MRGWGLDLDLPYPHPWSDENIMGLAAMRAGQWGDGVRGFRGGVEGVLEGIWAVYYVNSPLCRSLQFGLYGSPGSSGQLGCHRHMKL